MSEDCPRYDGWYPRREPAAWKHAVALIRSRVPAEDRDAFRRAIEEDSEAFAAAQHFTAGLTVRTLLRLHGVDHVALGARDPDDVWVEILRDAVADDAEGEGEP